MAGHNHFRLTVEIFIKMLHEEQDEENEEAVLGLDSESEISDAEDLDYVLQNQAGVVGVSRNPALLNEEGSFDETEDTSKEPSPKWRRKNKL